MSYAPTRRAFLVSLISTPPPGGALSMTSLRPHPRSQRSSASIASSYHEQCARARNIFILRCGTKDHVLLAPQSRQRVNSGRSPCRRIASENRGAYEDDTGQRQGSRIIGLGLEQKRF